MRTDSQQDIAFLEAVVRKHEYQNPRIGYLLLVAGLVTLTVAICQATVWQMMVHMARRRPLDPATAAHGIITAPNLELLTRFPAPNLQINSHADLVAFRAREEAELNTFGWVDRSNGIVRIPVERAMNLLLARGLPTRSSNAPATTGKSSLELIRERPENR